MVNNRGIEANPENVQAILDVQRPTNLKELQKLTGMVAALNRFIYKYSDRCTPLYKALKITKESTWNDECDKALNEMKQYMSRPPLISILEPHEQLYVYLASFDRAVSSALIREHDNIQKPM